MSLEEVTYPHPHVEPRQPRDCAKLQTNPPVFAWKPGESTDSFKYRLVVGRDADFKDRVLDLRGLKDPVYLPEEALESGVYYWRWSHRSHRSEVFSFEIPRSAVRIEVPPARVWVKAFSGEHPRFLFTEKPGAAMLESLKKEDPHSINLLFDYAGKLLTQSHHMAEPPYKGDRNKNYKRFRRIQYQAMWGSRKFANGAQTMALAYALGGGREYGRAAARRLASLAKWDPYGSTHLAANDEPHMSVIWYGAIAADWAWDCLTEKERSAVIKQMRTRAAITFEHMHDRGQYGIDRFDSHAGREIVFLANLLLIFHEHIPEAEAWLDWLRPTLCGIWPIWGDNDGSWAEGVSYSLAYVSIMTLFASALKRRTGVDLYRKPFWKNYAHWRKVCMPPYAEWIGFGDHTERWPSTWINSANTLELISRETGSTEFDDYIRQLREEVKTMPPTPPERSLVPISPPLLLAPPRVKKGARKISPNAALHAFKDAGWAAIRSDLEKGDRDVALIFRSSPYGSISHSHANNNDIILHAGGAILTMPSGYYGPGYGAAHHAHWVWHTKSHNCVTLSGAPQLLRSPDSRGELLCPYEDDEIAYVLGNADESYAERANRCRRHVIFFKKASLFLLLDDFQPRSGIVSSFQWNLHSWAKFKVKETRREFQLNRKGSQLTGMLLYHREGFFTLSEGWDPPIQKGIKNSDQWLPQYHLRFTPTPLVSDIRLGTPAICFGALLIPKTAKIRPPAVKTWMEDNVEIAEFNGNRIEIPIPENGNNSQCLAHLRIRKTEYRLWGSGIKKIGTK